MLSFVNSKTSLTTLAEWSPSDWPESLSEMRTIDNLLRCSICYEYFDVAVIVPDCSHNYCSLCIRRSLSYEPQCPTCKMKLNPPSLRNNRVLDELVKNFIKVRAKLLDLVTSHKKDGVIKNKSIVTSNKRRKASHARPESSSKSSSPGTKRLKLDDTEKEIITPIELAENSEAEGSNIGSVSATSEVIKTKGSDEHLNVTSKQEPMVVEESTVKRKLTTELADSDFSECPVCGDMVPHRKINSHLDSCLTRTEKKSSLRRKKTNGPKSLCSVLAKKKHLTTVECSKETDLEVTCISSDDDFSSKVTQETCSSNSTNGPSTLTTKGSNALIQTVQKRKPLPKLVYTVMAEKELRQRLREWNLSSKGDRATLVKRHQDFVMLYNAQCDAEKPMTAAQIAKEVEKAEKTRTRECLSLTEASTSGLRFDKNQTEEDRDKIRQSYLTEHQNDFSKLIANIRRRQQGKKKTTATKVSVDEIMDGTEDNPGETVMQRDSKDMYTGNAEGTEALADVEMTDKLPKRCTYSETQLPSLEPPKLNKYEALSSIIPEPPSSPSLLSLPDDDDEFTPSLGLEDDDVDKLEDCEEGLSKDPNYVIAESPVIKVGKAYDVMANRERVSSDSDDDLGSDAVIS